MLINVQLTHYTLHSSFQKKDVMAKSTAVFSLLLTFGLNSLEYTTTCSAENKNTKLDF